MASDEFFGLVRSWLTIHLPRSRQLSPHTIRSYKTALNALLDYLRQSQHLSLAEISFEVINRSTITAFLTWLLDSQHLGASSANQRLAAINSFLSYCAGEDPALVSIWLEVTQIKPARTSTRAPDGLSMPAVDALIRAPGQDTSRGRRDTTLILLTFDAAARIQEILDLAPADIDTTIGAARVTLTGKGRKSRTVPPDGQNRTASRSIPKRVPPQHHRHRRQAVLHCPGRPPPPDEPGQYFLPAQQTRHRSTTTVFGTPGEDPCPPASARPRHADAARRSSASPHQGVPRSREYRDHERLGVGR